MYFHLYESTFRGSIIRNHAESYQNMLKHQQQFILIMLSAYTHRSNAPTVNLKEPDKYTLASWVVYMYQPKENLPEVHVQYSKLE